MTITLTFTFDVSRAQGESLTAAHRRLLEQNLALDEGRISVEHWTATCSDMADAFRSCVGGIVDCPPQSFTLVDEVLDAEVIEEDPF